MTELKAVDQRQDVFHLILVTKRQPWMEVLIRVEAVERPLALFR